MNLLEVGVGHIGVLTQSKQFHVRSSQDYLSRLVYNLLFCSTLAGSGRWGRVWQNTIDTGFTAFEYEQSGVFSAACAAGVWTSCSGDLQEVSCNVMHCLVQIHQWPASLPSPIQYFQWIHRYASIEYMNFAHMFVFPN